MNLQLDLTLVSNYTSNSQISRVLTKSWVKKNSFCLNCNNSYLEQFSNNSPVADFYCENCSQEYELKSKDGLLSNKIVDGAYHTWVAYIQANIPKPKEPFFINTLFILEILHSSKLL